MWSSARFSLEISACDCCVPLAVSSVEHTGTAYIPLEFQSARLATSGRISAVRGGGPKGTKPWLNTLRKEQLPGVMQTMHYNLQKYYFEANLNL